MKHLCYSKFLLTFFLLSFSLFASVTEKSAIVYYGDKISYPTVGIHDYIIVEPNNINTSKHGFEVYKNKMYAYVSIGEIDPHDPAYKKLDSTLVVGKNKQWKSKLLDLTSPKYKEFLFKEMIEPQIKKGFKNFFFDTLDSYQLIAKSTKARKENEEALVDIINSFHKRYPDAKLIINRGFEIIDKVHNSVDALLFESYYRGLGGKNLAYKKVTNEDRRWLEKHLKKVRSYHLDIICVDYLSLKQIQKNGKNLVSKLKKKGFIPYVATKELDSYGRSSKNAIKREILTLIDENNGNRIAQGAHLYGALPLEYQGYIQKLYNVDKYSLPTMRRMQQYGGVIIWLTKKYKNPSALIDWILKLQKYNIKVVFMTDFFVENLTVLNPLEITYKNIAQLPPSTYNVVHQDKIMGFEISPPKSQIPYYIDIRSGTPLYTLENINKEQSTLAAIMPWGGFAIGQTALIDIAQDNLWTINPFEFFTKALRLPKIPVADTTTETGKRLLFSHIDGDGIMNKVEWNPKLFSGDTIYSDILKKYPIPISVSVIGSEINKNGLYPKISHKLMKITKKMYALPNVEPATHTFTHPFFWEKIIDGKLDQKFRLKPKNYVFSLDYEIQGMLDELNNEIISSNKKPKATTVFWSGNCAPTKTTLQYVYKNKILNINGGDTHITNLHPWLSYVAPMGLERDGYYQIYTGQQNENIYTNEWLGPFWGFKKVVQTFKLTDSPRRLKPIDIYYHLYSGSKRASLNALKYVYDWSIHQDVHPIFTSEYIPKAMDYYTVSIAEEKESYYISGLKNLKTLRLDQLHFKKDISFTKNLAGIQNFETHTYLHIGEQSSALLVKEKQKDKQAYLVSANGKILKMQRDNKHFSLQLHAHVPLKFTLFVPKNCKASYWPKTKQIKTQDELIHVSYKKNKKAKIDVQCGQ